jgi:valyl-tRNA synthetase
LQVLSKYATAIETLATCSKVVVTDKPPASGCAILTISHKVSAHLNLKGLIDPEKEKDKLLKKKVVLESQVNKLNKLTKDTGKICLRFFCNFFSAFTDNYLLQQIF